MADLTKTFNTGSSKGISAQITVTDTVDVTTNTSKVSVAVSLISTGYSGHIYYLSGTIKGDTNKTLANMSSTAGTHDVYIQEKNTYYPIRGLAGNQGSPWSFTVTHDADGSKTITVSVSIQGYTATGNGANGFSVSGSYTVVLPQIPRASTIGATDANIGSKSVIAVSRKSTAYTHSIQYKFGNLSGYVTASGGISQTEVKTTATSIAFAIPATFYDQIPNAKSANCTLTCRTYSGTTQIGDAQTDSFTVTAAEDLCAPQVSGTVEDTNALTISLTGNKSKLVRYASNALCTIAATARNSAAIKSKKINGQTVSGNTLEIEKASTSSVGFSATDSRGYTTTEYVAVNLIPYIPLTCVASGRRTNPTDGNAVISVRGNYFNNTFGAADNTLKVEYCIDGGDWVEVATATSGNSYTATANISGLDYTKSFAFTVRSTDKIGSVVQTVIIGKGIPVFDWGENDFTFHVPVNMNADIELKDHNLLKNGESAFAPAGYGLGFTVKDITASDLNSTTSNGWYRLAGDSLTIGGYTYSDWHIHVSKYSTKNLVQEMYTLNGYKAVRRCQNGTWYEEWENPPMSVGVEYRTTERYNGLPVYRKLVKYTNTTTMGNASGSVDYNIPHGISGFSELVELNAKYGKHTMIPYPTYKTVSGTVYGSVSGVTVVSSTDIVMRITNDTFSSANWLFSLAYTKS